MPASLLPMIASFTLALVQAPADSPKVKALVESAVKVGFSNYAALVRENVRAERSLKAMMDADEWAIAALALGHPNAAARVRLTWDRLQLSGGHPQRFGSISGPPDAEGKRTPRETDPTPASLGPATGADSPELKTLMETDQADRKGDVDWEAVGPRDAARRARVLTLLREGKATTGADAYNAALVLQHGDGYRDFMLAHELCLSAIARGYAEAAWLVSRTYDRMLENGGHAQRFGTQQTQGSGDAKAYVIEADLPGPSDALRGLFKAPLRAATRKGLDEWQKTIDGSTL